MFLFTVLVTSIFVAAGGAVTLIFRNMQRRNKGGQS